MGVNSYEKLHLSSASVFLFMSAQRSTGVAYLGKPSCCCCFSLNHASASLHSLTTYGTYSTIILVHDFHPYIYIYIRFNNLWTKYKQRAICQTKNKLQVPSSWRMVSVWNKELMLRPHTTWQQGRTKLHVQLLKWPQQKSILANLHNLMKVKEITWQVK